MKKLYSLFIVALSVIALFTPVAQSADYYTEVYNPPIISSDGKLISKIDVCGSSLERGPGRIPVSINVFEKEGGSELVVTTQNAWVDNSVITYIKNKFPKANQLFIFPASAPASVCK